MIVDTSALMAILQAEPEAERYSQLLAREDSVISAGTLLEARIVVQARGADKIAALETTIRGSDTRVVAADEEQARIGSDAYRRYGRGSKHPAKLNFGDCFSYALAIALDEPLLFKGDDFIHTDVRVAAP
ncbi:type II toxin-antitoxin system VapC family toxin [Microbacterium sp. A93]|uniref:type II toxin-antitoxin system VapC family toxin n=1 Tax=unclassified Microbacterium TaxID=2609290 RepID=UPI003F42B147